MIVIKNKQAINKMKQAGKLLSEIFDLLNKNKIISAGVSTGEINDFIAKELLNRSLVSQSLGYRGYRHVSCISINDEIVHGVPSNSKVLKDGDLVKVDVCAAYRNYCADMARCFFVGDNKKINIAHKKLVSVAKESLDAGIKVAKPGNRLSDISAAIESKINENNYGIVKDFAGHGIGKSMHEDPEIPNYGEAGKGPILRAGMTFAIEPMITMGSDKVLIDNDGWTARTKDNSLAAHVEDTIVITEQGAKILTRY